MSDIIDRIAEDAIKLKEELVEITAERNTLQEWKEAVLGRIKAIPEYTTFEWGGDREGWGFCFELIKWQTKEVVRLQEALADVQESLEMSCIEPGDYCQCAGCLYAAEVYARQDKGIIK